MAKVEALKQKLKKGRVYRREELLDFTNAVDRHLDYLVNEGTLQKLARGLYYVPKEGVFGAVPPDDETVVRSFLKDDNFLITSPNAYNSLGLGTTQLYNEKTVYNHKRKGKFKLGNQTYHFRLKPGFPKNVTREFLVVDLVNNLNNLAEDKEEVLKHLPEQVSMMNIPKLKQTLNKYGSTQAKKVFSPLLSPR